MCRLIDLPRVTGSERLERNRHRDVLGPLNTVQQIAALLNPRLPLSGEPVLKPVEQQSVRYLAVLALHAVDPSNDQMCERSVRITTPKGTIA